MVHRSGAKNKKKTRISASCRRQTAWRKHLATAVAALLLLTLSLSAQTGTTKPVTLAWDASPSKEVTGYILATGNVRGGPWKTETDVKKVLKATLTLDRTKPTFAVCIAYAGALRSKPSNEVCVFPPPSTASAVKASRWRST